MEDSMNSMMGKARSSSESPEESSWTFYLDEDFLTNNHYQYDQQHSSSSFTSGHENSIASDAASSISKNFRNICREQDLGFSNRSSSPSCIIKRKAKPSLLQEDALEDTATSPANSPKVWNILHSTDMKQNLQRDNRGFISMEKGSTSGNVDGTTSPTEVDFNERESDSTCTGLKKKGLCLVPFSSVVNYFG